MDFCCTDLTISLKIPCSPQRQTKTIPHKFLENLDFEFKKIIPIKFIAILKQIVYDKWVIWFVCLRYLGAFVLLNCSEKYTDNFGGTRKVITANWRNKWFPEQILKYRTIDVCEWHRFPSYATQPNTFMKKRKYYTFCINIFPFVNIWNSSFRNI